MIASLLSVVDEDKDFYIQTKWFSLLVLFVDYSFSILYLFECSVLYGNTL